MHTALKHLEQCADVGSLGLALRTLCSEFVSVSKMDILTMTNAGKRRAVCLLRLDSSEKEQNLMAKFGTRRFGEDLFFVVDLTMPNQTQA